MLPISARRLDADTESWCEEQIAAHFAALSSATTPQQPLRPGRIEYTSSAIDALDRWSRAWSAVVRLPFSRAAWAHVHRCDRWANAYRPRELGRGVFESWTHLAVDDRTGWSRARGELIDLAHYTLALHLALRDHGRTPVAPLAAMLVRRIVPLALPGNAMLLYVDAADAPIAHTSARDELAFVHALADEPDDRATRDVYADYLEERGDHAGALAQRLDPAEARPNVLVTYPHTRWITPPHPLSNSEHFRPQLAGGPPRAHIELANRSLPLGADSRLVWCAGAAVIDNSGAPEERHVRLFHADDTVWLEVPSPEYALVNGEYTMGCRPLFDRDALCVRLTARCYVDGMIRYS